MKSIRTVAVTVARIVLGLPLVLIPISYFFHLAAPPHEGAALRLIEELVGTGYLMHFVKATQLAVGVALLSNRFVPLALVVLAPVMLNIVAFHLFIEPGTIAFPAALAALHAFLAYAHRASFASLFRARAEIAPDRADEPLPDAARAFS